MKQPRSEASITPSKLCRMLLLALAVKVILVGFMLVEPAMGLFDQGATKTAKPLTVAVASISSGVAHAAPAAPPAVAPTPASSGASSTAGSTNTLGTNSPAPPQGATPATMPGASANRTLPPIGGKTAQNATVQDGLTKDTLTRKQEELARKEQELRALENQISEKLQRMELLENRLAVMMKDAENANDAQFRHLVDVLSNMKAKAAAQVLETLEQRIAVRVLAGMRGRQAGEILSFVRPEVAASLTAALTRMQLPLE